MEIHLLLPQKQGDGGGRAKMVELGSDVFLGRLDQAIVALEIGMAAVLPPCIKP